MSDYIKRENVIDELIDVGDTFDPETVIGNTVRKELARLKIKIMRIPTADVTEEKHGKWIKATVCYTQPSEEFTKGVEFILKKIDNAPTVDAVEVVRCKDCEYYHLMEEGFYDCREVWGLDLPQPEDFCSYGKRREENNV